MDTFSCGQRIPGKPYLGPMMILTVFFVVADTEHDNLQPKLNKLVKSLNLWKSRSPAISVWVKLLVVNVKYNIGDRLNFKRSLLSTLN